MSDSKSPAAVADAGEVKTYRLDRVSRAKRAVTRRAISFLVVIAVVIAAFDAQLIAKDMREGADPIEAVVRPTTISVVIFMLIAWYVLVFARKTARVTAEPYTLTLGPHVLRRSLGGVTDIEISRTEVTCIECVENRGLTLRVGRERSFFISATLQEFDDLRERLSAWRPLEKRGAFASFIESLRERETKRAVGKVLLLKLVLPWILLLLTCFVMPWLLASGK
jgi:hypothetical protein